MLYYKKYLILPLLLLSSGSVLTAMEQPQDQAIIEKYDENRDGQDVRSMFQKNWDHIYHGKGYSEELAQALLDVTHNPEDENASLKEAKVLRNHKDLLGLVTYYRFYKRNKPEQGEQGWLEVLITDSSIPAQKTEKYKDVLMYTALQGLKNLGTPTTQMWILKEYTPEIAQAEKFGFVKVGETPMKKAWRYNFNHTPDQQEKLDKVMQSIKE